MTVEERRNLKKEIKQMIKKMEIEVRRLEESTEPIKPENSIGRISRMDAINNKSVIEASLRNRKKKLSKMRLALSKIDDEAFGRCIACGKGINPKRIALMPESDRCIRCA